MKGNATGPEMRKFPVSDSESPKLKIAVYGLEPDATWRMQKQEKRMNRGGNGEDVIAIECVCFFLDMVATFFAPYIAIK